MEYLDAVFRRLCESIEAAQWGKAEFWAFMLFSIIHADNTERGIEDEA